MEEAKNFIREVAQKFAIMPIYSSVDGKSKKLTTIIKEAIDITDPEEATVNELLEKYGRADFISALKYLRSALRKAEKNLPFDSSPLKEAPEIIRALINQAKGFVENYKDDAGSDGIDHNMSMRAGRMLELDMLTDDQIPTFIGNPNLRDNLRSKAVSQYYQENRYIKDMEKAYDKACELKIAIEKGQSRDR